MKQIIILNIQTKGEFKRMFEELEKWKLNERKILKNIWKKGY